SEVASTGLMGASPPQPKNGVLSGIGIASKNRNQSTRADVVSAVKRSRARETSASVTCSRRAPGTRTSPTSVPDRLQTETEASTLSSAYARESATDIHDWAPYGTGPRKFGRPRERNCSSASILN